MKPFPLPRFFDALRFLSAITEHQIVSRFYGGDHVAARVDIAAAAAGGFISIEHHLIRHRPTPRPIAVLAPHQTPPCAEQLAYVASRLWNPSSQPELVIRATAKFAAFFGGQHCVVPSVHLSHEVGLSSVFFTIREADPAFQWTLIAQSGPRGGRADAVTRDGTLIELIGRYSGVKVGQKLALAAAVGVTLELW